MGSKFTIVSCRMEYVKSPQTMNEFWPARDFHCCQSFLDRFWRFRKHGKRFLGPSWGSFRSSWSSFGDVRSGIVRFWHRQHEFLLFWDHFRVPFGSQNQIKKGSRKRKNWKKFSVWIFITFLGDFIVKNEVSKTGVDSIGEKSVSRLCTFEIVKNYYKLQ